MKKAFKEFLAEFIFDKNDYTKISKTKAGIWLGVVTGILYSKGILTKDTIEMIAYISSGIFGVGVRDLFAKKGQHNG